MHGSEILFLTSRSSVARVLRALYRQTRRDTNASLQSNNSATRLNYLRIFILASVDIILILPFGIVNLVLGVTTTLTQTGHFPFYPGWTLLHSNWEPTGLPYSKLVARGPSALAVFYFAQWTSPVLSFAIFGLFGITTEARASYWRVTCIVCGWFGWKPESRAHRVRTLLGTMEFGERPQDLSLGLETGLVSSLCA